MTIHPVSAQTESIEKMGQLLKQMTQAQMNLDNKMMKVDVTAQVEGLGENLDIQA